MSKSSSSASTRSSRVVQQTHPLPSRTVRSSTRRNRWWSSPTSPNSLTRTAVLAIEGSSSTLPSNVVLPLPRKPVTTVIGRLERPPSTGLPPIRREGLEQGGLQGVRGPAREPGGGRPQGAEVLDDLRAPLAVAHHVLAPAPVVDLKAVEAQDLVRQRNPVDAVAAPVALLLDRIGAGRGGARPVLQVPVRPVDLRHEILSAEHAHGVSLPRKEPCPTRPKRRLRPGLRRRRRRPPGSRCRTC